MTDFAGDCRANAERLRSGPLAKSANAPTSKMAMALAKDLDKMADFSERVDRLFAQLDVETAHLNRRVFGRDSAFGARLH